MYFKLLIITLVCCTLAPPPGLAHDAPATLQDIRPLKLEGGWEYRWGDSPVTERGTPLWIIEENAGPEWSPISSFITPPGATDQNYVWYKIQLPEQYWIDPAIYFPILAMSFEVYLDTTQIYAFGEMQWNEDLKYSMVTNHLIPLGNEFQGRRLWIRIYSHDASIIGVSNNNEHVWIGSETDLIKILIKKNADSTILGLLFIFSGIFAAFMGRFREKTLFPFSFGVFSILIGLFYLCADPFLTFIIQSPLIKLYVRILSFMLFPIGLYMFLQHIVRTRWIIKALCLLHCGFALVTLILDLLQIVPLPLSMKFYSILFLGTIVVSVSVAVRVALRGNTEARIFVAGFTILGLLGLNDILMGLEKIPFWRWMSHWGALVFVMSLVYILERRFTENHKKLKLYSKELENKSEQLEEYSKTLETKVEKRTEDLSVKNIELQDALTRLRDAQQQLVIQEKMASLGNLVAGVAHEINNPIGAVASAADVSSRCLDRLQETIEQGDSVQHVLDSRHFQTAMRLLKENTAIALEGSNRVTMILSSLKNFARLDEADLKEADIHEGIDSTLTLLNHRLKNKVEIVKKYGNIPKIQCYPNQLNQVFMNLFSNAVDAIENKGMLTIETYCDETNLFISVTDTGRGISEQNLSHVFDPGFTTKGVGVGTGLGLSISYTIIQKHGGSLKVHSIIGKGSTFTISLPL